MIGKKVLDQFRDSYGNANMGQYWVEILDKFIGEPDISVLNRVNGHNANKPNIPITVTFYLVITFDPCPEIRSETYKWQPKIYTIYPYDILEIKNEK